MIRGHFAKTGKTYEIALKGHACAGEPGQDIICSAASILAYTAARCAEKMGEAGEFSEDYEFRAEGGDFFLRVSGESGKADEMFRTICTGFEILADTAPDNMTFWQSWDTFDD